VTEDEKYIAFCLTSADGKALAETRKALISLVSASMNTGFKLDSVDVDGTLDSLVGKRGGAPVLSARVGGIVEAKALDGMRYVFRGWGMEEIESGVVKNGQLAIPVDKPVFVVELAR
jgi:hypothetical protein